MSVGTHVVHGAHDALEHERAGEGVEVVVLSADPVSKSVLEAGDDE